MVCSLFAETDELSNTDKMIYYESERKNTLTAVTLQLIIPNGGFKYINNSNHIPPLSWLGYGSGLAALAYFKRANERRMENYSIDLANLECSIEYLENSSLSSLHNCDRDNYWYNVKEDVDMGNKFAGIFIFFHLIQMPHLINETEKYNNNLYRKIFNKEPPSFSLNLQPTYQGANLTMSYAFN